MPYFDRSLLPAARLEFAVVADTHYLHDVGDAPLEFESRRRQGRRAGAAWAAVAALEPAFVVHLGDLVQEFPGRPDYRRAVGEALGQIDAAGLTDRCRFAAGNHDLGDKPDPTMPTREVTAQDLAAWHGRHGPSWYSWDAAGFHFIVLNSQLLNTALDERRQQRDWLEADLAAHEHTPTVLFLHLPLFLRDPQEPFLGHYDNVSQPDRGWLLDRLCRHGAVALFSGHVHFQFYNTLPGARGPTRFWVAPSTSFTRPGFSHLFTSAAPPERGRDDTGKLGFFLCRAVGDRLDVHRVRTGSAGAADAGARLLTPLPSASGTAPPATGFALGVTLRHPLATTAEVPLAWPSAIRQPVRNDYPLLSCLELGARWVRVPATDLADPLQSRRLAALRDEGVGVQAVALGEEEALRSTGLLASADRLEVQLPGRTAPQVALLQRLADGGRPLALCPVLPRQPVPGKQHGRTRFGFLPPELPALGQLLDQAGVEALAVCRLDGRSPWDDARSLARLSASRDWGLQLLCELPAADDDANGAALARALAAAAGLDAPLLAEPLIDLDRTMDASHGLLDTLCNPRSTFDLARCLAALLPVAGAVGTDPAVELRLGWEVVSLGRGCCLFLPGQGPARLADLAPVTGLETGSATRVCRLAAGAVGPYDPQAVADPAQGPLLAFCAALAIVCVA